MLPIGGGRDVTGLRTVCLFLGPYRNLTTLTAGVIALHPTCQVLNHGKRAVFRDVEDNFLREFRPETFERFLRVGIEHSASGSRGDAGGSITHSHAFDHEVMREVFAARYGDATRKDVVECLVWKEPLRSSNALRKHAVDIGALLEQEPRLRFLMPIRRVIDTARSNIKTGHVEIFRGLRDHTLESVVDAVLDEIAWFLDQRDRWPERFFSFFQDDLDAPLLAELATFLDVDAEERWIRDAMTCYRLTAAYDYEPEQIVRYRASIKHRLERHPAIRDRLLAQESDASS